MVKLGDRVRDAVTGFEGIVVLSHHHLAGYVRFTVQPPVDMEGRLPGAETFDGPQLQVIGTSPAIGFKGRG